ncbi:MAG: hypothetical protein WAN43_10730 [Rhodomicrobium sp.]
MIKSAAEIVASLQEDSRAKSQRAIEAIEAIRAAHPVEITRRAVLLGLTAMIAAPYVVRNSGILMPVRDRTFPTLAEVRGWREGIALLREQGAMVSYTAEGFAEIARMADAERRYRDRGLL